MNEMVAPGDDSGALATMQRDECWKARRRSACGSFLSLDTYQWRVVCES